MAAAWVLLIVAGLLIFYIVAGYPLLLALNRRRSARPVAKDLSWRTSVSIVVAVHNGAAFIRAKLDTLFALAYPKELLQIIVVSDGSTDQTEAIVRECAGDAVLLLSVPRGGKVAALNHALAHATGEIVFFTDVRQPLEPQALTHLVANFADPTIGAVSGELRLLRGDTGRQADMELYWRYELWARKRHSAIDSIYTTTGCIYAMRRSLIHPIPADTLTDDAALPLGAFFSGFRVILDPEAIAFDYPTSSGAEFRRRFRTLAGMWQVFTRMPWLFTRANRMRFHFLSHKFSRLVLPWALLIFVAASLALPPSPFRTLLLLAEAALPVLALLDVAIPAGFPLKRLTSPARTFIVMNAASLAAVAVFFVPAGRLWKPTK